jgi:glucokinase
MVRSMLMLIGHYPESMLREFLKPGDDGSEPTIGSSVIAECFEKGDPLVCSVVHASADLLGLAIANLITVLSLPTVVLGGGVTQALGKPWLHRVREAVEQHVFPSSLRKCEVVSSELGDDAGLLGAAMLARETAQGRKG